MLTAPRYSAAGYNVSWQTREGAPYSANDLARVSAGSAQTIILLRPESAMVWPFGHVIDNVCSVVSCDMTCSLGMCTAPYAWMGSSE